YDDTTPSQPVARYRLRGAGAAAAFLFCAVPLLLGFVLPVTQLAAWTATVVPAAGAPELGVLARNSFLLAAAAAAACVALAVVIAFAARLDRSPLTRSLGKVVLLGYSIPG